MPRCGPESKKAASRLLGKSGRSVHSVSQEPRIGDRTLARWREAQELRERLRGIRPE